MADSCHETGEKHWLPLRETLPRAFVEAIEESYDSQSDSNSICLNEKSVECKSCKRPLEFQQDLMVSEVSQAALTVSHNMKNAKRKRKMMLQKEKIDEIMLRVERALEHSDMDDIAETKNKLTKRQNKNRLSELFNQSQKLSNSRKCVIQDLDSWFFTLRDDLKRFLLLIGSEDKHYVNLGDFYELFEESHKLFNKLLFLIRHYFAMKKKSLSEGENDGSEPDDSEMILFADKNKEDRLKLSKKIFTEEDFASKENLNQATKNVMAVLEEGMRAAAHKQNRSNFKVCLKQGNVLWSFIDNKVKLADELLEKIKNLDTDQFSILQLKEQAAKDAEVIANLEGEISQLKQQVERLLANLVKEEVVQPKVSLVEQVADDDNDNDNKVEEVEVAKGALSTVENALTVRGKPKSRISSLRFADVAYGSSADLSADSKISEQTLSSRSSASRISFQPSTATVKPSTDCTEPLRDEIETLKETLRKNEARFKEQESRMEKIIVKYENSGLKSPEKPSVTEVQPTVDVSVYVKKIKALSEEVESLKKELSAQKDLTEEHRNNEMMQSLAFGEMLPVEDTFEEQMDDGMMEELPHSQMLARIKLQLELEIRKLRNFIIKERHRFQANLRRMHMEHQKTVLTLKAGHAKTMRALVRFKTAVKRLTNAGEDDIIDDVEEVGFYGDSTNSTNAIDMLVQMEKDINRLLLEKRMLVSQANAAARHKSKDLETQSIYLQRTTESCRQQRKLVVKIQTDNEALAKQRDLLQASNKIMRRNIAPCKTFLERCLSSYSEPAPESEKASLDAFQQEETQQLSWKQASNRKKLINIGLDSHRMPAQDHLSAASVLSRTRNIVLEYFAHFVRRYVLLRRFERIKRTVVAAGKQRKQNERFKEYMRLVEEEMKMKGEEWSKKKAELEKEKELAALLLTDLLQRRDGTALTVDCTCLLKSEEITYISTGERLTTKKKNRFHGNVKTVVGEGLETSHVTPSYWRMPGTSVPERLVQRHIPKLLELDINKMRQVDHFLPAIATLYP